MMAARSHVDVNERRLRPIYDCLDNGNNKKAIQEADKVLRKQKDFQCAKVLKGLALLRMGRPEDSSTLLEEVHTQHPTDDASLQAMAICYREMQKLELIADMYENANKAKPENEEILSSMFMAYVRLGDYKKQQQTAMALHRLRPSKNPYYFWAIMSIVMQAHTSDSKLAQAMFLPLAERMTEKYVTDDRIEAEAEVQMYLIILELMGRYEKALDIVQGPLGAQVLSEPNYQQWKSAELLSAMEKWPQINAIYRRLLVQETDHWNYYLQYFKSVFALVDAGWTPEQDTEGDPIDHSIPAVITFIESQVAGALDSSHCPRGPYLAQMELVKRLKERNSEHVQEIAAASDLLCNYFKQFGSKLCCFSDMKVYLSLLDTPEQIQLIKRLLESLDLCGEDGSLGLAKDTKTMQRHQCVLQLERYCGLHHSLEVAQKYALVQDLVLRHKEGLAFGEGLLATDLQYSDNYLIMAAHVLVNLHQDTGNNKCLWQTITILERGLLRSPSNFQFKVLLIRLYATLGAFGPASLLYDQMEIKHIQHDALGYVISNHASRLSYFTLASSIYENMLKFFHVNHRDISECLISSYKFGSFTKIHEFVKFRDRLQNSLQHASAKVEKQLIELTRKSESCGGHANCQHSSPIDPAEDSLNVEHLHDNRDLNILTSWDPPEHAFTQDIKLKSFKEELAWLQVRHLSLRLLTCASELAKRTTNHAGDSMKNGGTLPCYSQLFSNLTQRLRSHLDRCQMEDFPKQYPLCGPFRTRLRTYLSLQASTLFLEMLDVTCSLNSVAEAAGDSVNEKVEAQMKSGIPKLLTEIVGKHTSCLSSDDGYVKILEPDVVEHLVMLTELIGQLSLLLGACHQLLKPMRVQLNKKNKKKKAAAAVDMPSCLLSFLDLVAGMETATKQLHSTIHTIDVNYLSSDLGKLRLFDDVTEGMPNDEDMENLVTTQVRESYQRTAKELLDYLNSRLRFFTSLKH